MNRDKKSSRYNMQDGFSLVEVIIAVTILGILSLAILSYFTNASVSTSRGKDQQSAEFVAETLVEGVNSLNSFEQLTASGTAVVGDTVTGTAIGDVKLTQSDDEKTVVEKDITQDGFDYHVVTEVNYQNYREKAGTSGVGKDGNGKDSYNDYEVPQLKEVYSPNNVVVEETDQAETVLSEFYYENQDKTKQEILNDMSRTMFVDITKMQDSENRDLYDVKTYFKYQYKGEKKTAAAGESKVEKDKLQSIYLFYKVLRSNIQKEEVMVTFSSTTGIAITKEEVQKVSLYFVLQDTSSTEFTAKRKANYELKVGPDGDAMFGYAKYYFNRYPGESGGLSGPVNTVQSVVERTKQKRIATVLVKVYTKKQGVTDYSSESPLVVMDSSKTIQ